VCPVEQRSAEIVMRLCVVWPSPSVLDQRIGALAKGPQMIERDASDAIHLVVGLLPLGDEVVPKRRGPRRERERRKVLALFEQTRRPLGITHALGIGIGVVRAALLCRTKRRGDVRLVPGCKERREHLVVIARAMEKN